jgi:Cu+-exporting ATPase
MSDVARFVKAIVNAGYTALPVGSSSGGGGPGGVVPSSCALAVSGMVCEADPKRIAALLLRIDGVYTCACDWPASDVIKLTWDPNLDGVGVRSFLSVVHSAGYAATLPPGSAQSDLLDAAQAKETAALKRSFLISLALTLPLTIMSMGLMHWEAAWEPLETNLLPARSGRSLPVHALVQLSLCTPVQLGVGLRFYRRAWAALKHGSTNMDVLIAVGTSVAYFYSVAVVLVDTDLFGAAARAAVHEEDNATFFETSAVLITFVMLGGWLQSYSKSKTGSAVRGRLGSRGWG